MDHKLWSSIRIMINAKKTEEIEIAVLNRDTNRRNSPGKIRDCSSWKLAAYRVLSMQLCKEAILQGINREAQCHSETCMLQSVTKVLFLVSQRNGLRSGCTKILKLPKYLYIPCNILLSSNWKDSTKLIAQVEHLIWYQTKEWRNQQTICTATYIYKST